jgi:hypothetical protein
MKDTRPERFKELYDGMKRVDRLTSILCFVGVGLILGLNFLRRSQTEGDWVGAVLFIGLFVVLFGLIGYDYLSKLKLARRLNIFCEDCRKVPQPPQLPLAIASRSCPRCGKPFEIEPSAQTHH